MSLLGGLRIAGRGGMVDGRALGRRGEIVFARLALEAGSSVSREALAEAVWGEAQPASWRAALRNVVAQLRRALAFDGVRHNVTLTASDGGYRLTLPPGSTVDLILLRADLDAAEQALRSSEHRLAAEVSARGLSAASHTLLPGGHEDWLEGLRLEVDELRLRFALVAAKAAVAQGDHVRAERLARGLIASSPLREESHRLLIGALRGAGNRAQALAAYDACRRLLAKELGALPAAETQELFLEILAEERAQQSGQLRARTPVAAAGPLLRLAAGTRFVGRAALIDDLVGRLGLVESAGVLVVSLCGEPGLGKTRLAAEVATRARAMGLAVLYGRAEDRLAPPFAAFLEAVDQGLASVDPHEARVALGDNLEVLGTLLPGVRGEIAPNRDDRVDERRVGQAIIAALAMLAGRAGALVVLDDMQWASSAELGVLEMLLAAPERARALVLVLHRDRDDLRRLQIAEHPRLTRLALEPLTVEDVAQLVPDTSGATPAREQAAQVWRASGGNPLLAIELLRHFGERFKGERPARIDELVRRRLAALPPGAEEVLRLAAVEGLEFEPGTIAAAGMLDPEQALGWLQDARRAGLLIGSDHEPGWLAFRHGLVRDALLDSLEPIQRARLHERVGTLLEQRAGEATGALVSLAYHFGAAAPLGDWRRAVRYALPVARQAYETGIYEDVIAVATRALSALERAGNPDPDAQLDLEVLLGGAQRALGEPAGRSTLARAFEAAARRGDPVRMADAALALSHAGALSDELAIDDQALALYERALETLGDRDPHRRAQLLGRLANGYAWRQSGQASRRASDQAVALARELSDHRTLAAVLTTARRSLASCADIDEQERLEHELLTLAAELDDPGLHVSARLWRFDSSVQRGQGEQLARLLREAGTHARVLRMAHYHHSLAYEQASLALLRGRVAEAETLTERAARVGRELGLDPLVIEAIRVAQLTVVRTEQRRLTEVREDAAAVLEPHGIPAWLGLLAYIDAGVGRFDRVAERVDATLDHFDAAGPTATCPVGIIAYLAAPAVRLGDADRVHRIRGLIAPYSDQGAYFACFAGPVDYHLSLLDRCLGDEPAAREHLRAAADFCRRLGAPRWQARCETALTGEDPELGTQRAPEPDLR